MSSNKLRIHNTDTGNLVSNLRGEVGEIISSWVLMRRLMVEANSLKTLELDKDLENPQLTTLNILIDKLSDEIVARLAEVAESKIGRLTFHFAQIKLNRFQKEVDSFAGFIEKNSFREKRNYDISHKELPEQWSDHKYIHIPYPTLVKGIATALKLMKMIDAAVLGPSGKYLWHEMRKRRYRLTHPAKVGYMLLPYIWPSPKNRLAITAEEIRAGCDVWVDMPVTVNGRPMTIKACGRWGAIVLDGRVVLLDESFLELTTIAIGEEIEGNEQEYEKVV